MRWYSKQKQWYLKQFSVVLETNLYDIYRTVAWYLKQQKWYLKQNKMVPESNIYGT